MPHLSIDIILFSVFLALNLVIGLLAGRHVKTTRDFAIGNKDFSTGTIVSTIVATGIGGGFMFYGLKNTYTDGLLFILPLLGATLCLLLMGRVLSIRMGEFLNNLSVAEAIGSVYGPIVRLVTALSGIIVGVGYVAMQFQVIAKILNFLSGFEGPQVTITAAAIIILYSAFGGIRAVTITDVFQFIAFSIFIPILALVVWNHLKTPMQVSQILTTYPIFNLKTVIAWNPPFFTALGLMLFWTIPGLTPSAFQRISMAKDLKQVKDSFTYAAGATLLITMSVVLVGILLLADNPHLEPNNLVNYIITQYAYTGLKGLIAVGITAMAMSTADSDLNAAAVLAVNDIIKPLKPDWKESMVMVRLVSLGLGICGLVLALYTKGLLELMLMATSFYMPIVTVPLLLAIFGFRSSRRAVLIGMGAGLITVLGWDKLLGHTGINNVIPGMLANLIFLMGSHYILREKDTGWIGIKDKGPLLAARQARRDWWVNLMHTLKNTTIYDYLQKNLPTHDVIYSLFGVYVLGATYACFFTILEPMVVHYQKLYDIAAHSVLIATAGFLTYPAWPPTFRAKWFITYAWPVGICYILFVVGTLLVVMSGFHQVQVMIFLLNLVLAAMLLAWPLMVFVAILGTFVGTLIFQAYYGPIYLTGSVDSIQFKFIYGILLCSSFLIAIFRFKQKAIRLEDQKSRLAASYEDTKDELVQVLAYREELVKETNQEDISYTAAYLKQIIYRLTDYIRLEVTKIDLAQLILSVKELIKLQDFDTFPQLIIEKHTHVAEIYADAFKIKQLLVNSIEDIQQHNLSNKPIRLVVEDATLGHYIGYMKNYTKEVAALKMTLTLAETLPTTQEIYNIFNQNMMESVGSRKILAENSRIIDAHYGYGKVDTDHTYVYVIPTNVREVRGKVMELLREPAIADPIELQHPTAIRLEKELLDKLKNTKINLQVVFKALDTIKRYHAGVKRKSGEPFFSHPIAVALILLEYCQDQDAMIAALLHDTVEDTSLSIMDIKAMFGDFVAFIVGKVTNLEDKMRRISLGDHENIHRLLDYYKDERAAYVKLADRLHNMRTIQWHTSLAKQKHIAGETLSFFVPMAQSLRLTSVAVELEQLSLDVLGRKG